MSLLLSRVTAPPAGLGMADTSARCWHTPTARIASALPTRPR